MIKKRKTAKSLRSIRSAGQDINRLSPRSHGVIRVFSFR
jgi:hypothetical protein